MGAIENNIQSHVLIYLTGILIHYLPLFISIYYMTSRHETKKLQTLKV